MFISFNVHNGSLTINVHKPYPESRSPSSLTDFGANLTTFKAASVPRRTYNGSGGLLFSMMVACLHASTSRFSFFLELLPFYKALLDNTKENGTSCLHHWSMDFRLN